MMVMTVKLKVKEGRDVWPNKGFLQQLIDWENSCGDRFFFRSDDIDNWNNESHQTIQLIQSCPNSCIYDKDIPDQV